MNQRTRNDIPFRLCEGQSPEAISEERGNGKIATPSPFATLRASAHRNDTERTVRARPKLKNDYKLYFIVSPIYLN